MPLRLVTPDFCSPTIVGRTLAARNGDVTDVRRVAYAGIKGGFDGFARAVLKLRKELNVPHALPGLIKGLDMDKKRKGLIADMAIVDPTAGGNPVKLTRKAALSLLENALNGRV